jgi:hypothetical protein
MFFRQALNHRSKIRELHRLGKIVVHPGRDAAVLDLRQKRRCMLALHAGVAC